jgi:hypothetical protein
MRNGRAAAARGAALLDTSGAPLTLALKAPVLPDIIKPNRRELAAWAGEPLETIGDVVRCCQRLRAGHRLVVVSMGEEGACSSLRGRLLARLPAGELASTVGAGDAMVAGLPPRSRRRGWSGPRGSPPPLRWPSWADRGRICPIWARSMPERRRDHHNNRQQRRERDERPDDHIFAIVEAGETGVSGVLAGEACAAQPQRAERSRSVRRGRSIP